MEKTQNVREVRSVTPKRALSTLTNNPNSRDEALKTGVEANLARWHDLIESYQISPLDASVEHKHFTDKLGNSPSIILVRPDSYIGFIGDENSVLQLTEYMAKWLTLGP